MPSFTLPHDLDALSGLSGPGPAPLGSQVLEHALDLLATPDAWCKGALEKQAGLAFVGTVTVLDDGRVTVMDAGPLGAPAEVQLVTQRCLIGAVRRALLSTGHVHTGDGQPAARVYDATRVALQVVRTLGDAVIARYPWAAAARGSPIPPLTPGIGWEPCGCATCTSEELPGEAAAVRFNDYVATTHDQVVEVLKDARGLVLDAELAGVR